MRNRVGVEALPGSALISLLSTKMYSFSVALLLALSSSASAFGTVAGVRAPTRSCAAVRMGADEPLTRRAAMAGLLSTTLAAGALPAFADEEVLAPPPPPPPPPPPARPAAAYKLEKNYPSDAKAMLINMQIATEMTRGTPNMENIVKQTRGEMNDFVAFYRRQPKVAGMPSFSTLYTAINTLSGHYASYGNKYPVPEKRRVSTGPAQSPAPSPLPLRPRVARWV